MKHYWRDINEHVDAFVIGFLAGFATAVLAAILMTL